MEKFTKGEWICIDGTTVGEQILFVHAVESGVNKGIVCRLTKQVDTHINLSLEDVANAHLIAAAPKMFQALLSIENDNGSIPEAIWDLRNEAIAKARGE